MTEKKDATLVLETTLKRLISKADIVDYKTSIGKTFYFDIADVLMHIIRGSASQRANKLNNGETFTTGLVEIKQAAKIYNKFYTKESTLQECIDQAFLTGQMNSMQERAF